MNIMKCSRNSLLGNLNLDRFVFICSASYESRCQSVAKLIAGHSSFSAIFGIENLNKQIDDNVLVLKKVLPEADVVRTYISDPEQSASLIDKEIHKLLMDGKSHNVVLDITTFTHEHLLFLLKSLYLRRDKISTVKCIYTDAKEYSFEEKGKKKWLSKGCRDLRSVIGYPGIIYPGMETLVILIVGFEHERAGYVIEEMSPEYLYLGFGRPDKAIDAAHKAPMRIFNQIVATNMATRKNVYEFKFSSSDPDELHKKLADIIAMTPTCNHIIVPMNTKLSTLAVALIAFEDKAVQVCYSQPETYNFKSYSKKGSSFRVVDVNMNRLNTK